MARKSRKNINAAPMGSTEAAGKDILTEQMAITANKKLATAAYCRLSVENNGRETDDSIQTQIALVEGYVREHEELYLAGTFVDNGISGTRFDRPEFVRMIEAVKSGRIQCIVVKDLSRFGRDYLEAGYYIENIFPLLKVRFIAITDQFDSMRKEDLDSLSIPIKNMVNAMYAKDYSRKQEIYREMCKKTGVVADINVPYGYVLNKETGRLEIDKEVEPYVRMIFAWGLAGVKYREIAMRMELIGAPTAATHDNWDYGEHWCSDSVNHILSNPAYAGFHVMGKSKVSLYSGIPGHRIPREDWVYFPDYHEAYITMEDYGQLDGIVSRNQKEMHERMGKRAEARKKMPDVFQGMLFCANCGGQMNFARGNHHRGSDDWSFMYYRCRKKAGECSNSNRKYQQNYFKIVVMDQIRNMIKAVCDKGRLIEAMQREMSKPGSMNHVQRNVARLSQRIQEVEERTIKAYEDFAEKLLDEEDYIMVKEKLNRDKLILADKRDKMNDKLKEMERVTRKYREQAQHLEEYLEVKDFDERLVKELVSRILVSSDDTVTLEFKCGDVYRDALVDEFLAENGKEEA
jgi:DNA invertase Pin-like site-specific DNA recombinase